MIDPIVIGLEHVPFNTELLAALHATGLFREIAFFAESGHRADVVASLPASQARSLAGGPIAARQGIRKKMLDWPLMRLLMREARVDGTVVVFLSSNRCTIFSLALARLFGGARGRRAIHVFHAELATLWWPRRRNPLKSVFDLFTAIRLIAWAGDNIVLLEQGIREEFVRQYPSSAALALLWPHPVSPVGAQEVPAESRVPRIGFLGWASIEKGFGRYVAVAREVRLAYGDRVSFWAISHQGGEAQSDESLRFLDVRPRQKRWPREEFLRAAAELDFVCLFYDERYYRYVASGVLIDAMALAKPIIAPRIRLIESIVEEHGEIGLLYGNDAELTQVVREAIDVAGTDRYRRMVENLKRAAESRTTPALAQRIARDLGRR